MEDLLKASFFKKQTNLLTFTSHLKAFAYTALLQIPTRFLIFNYCSIAGPSRSSHGELHRLYRARSARQHSARSQSNGTSTHRASRAEEETRAILDREGGISRHAWHPVLGECFRALRLPQGAPRAVSPRLQVAWHTGKLKIIREIDCCLFRTGSCGSCFGIQG